MFTTTIGTILDQHNIRRGFRQITRTAGLGEDWVPRELRHTLVSIMSAGGVPVEEIARLTGHQQTSTTRAGLPPRTAPSNHHRRRAHGPDLLVVDGGYSVSAVTRSGLCPVAGRWCARARRGLPPAAGSRARSWSFRLTWWWVLTSWPARRRQAGVVESRG